VPRKRSAKPVAIHAQETHARTSRSRNHRPRLARYLEGERIARVSVNRADLRRAFPAGLVQALTGATVTSLGRRAKYGLIHTDRGQTMVFHLGMSGRWRIDRATPDRHDHLYWKPRPAMCWR